MKKGIIICLTTCLLAFAITFWGLKMVDRMAVKEAENKSVEEKRPSSKSFQRWKLGRSQWNPLLVVPFVILWK